ncbi:MAG: hypothetical protein AAF544_10680, partial [Bacteroidota bacterium]
ARKDIGRIMLLWMVCHWNIFGCIQKELINMNLMIKLLMDLLVVVILSLSVYVLFFISIFYLGGEADFQKESGFIQIFSRVFLSTIFAAMASLIVKILNRL